MEIIWSDEAKKTFKNNVKYLKKYWSQKEVDSFVFEAFRTLEIIKKMPHIGRYDNYFQCNILVIVEQISLFYDIKDNKIILLTFWDNRQKPIQLLR